MLAVNILKCSNIFFESEIIPEMFGMDQMSEEYGYTSPKQSLNKCVRCGNASINGDNLCPQCREKLPIPGRIQPTGEQIDGIPVFASPPCYGMTGQQIAEKASIDLALRAKHINDAKEFTGNKYHRKIIGLDGTVITTDVYRVLDAFDVREPGLQHAIKKLLCAGIRGKNDLDSDLKEAIDAITATRLSVKQKNATSR